MGNLFDGIGSNRKEDWIIGSATVLGAVAMVVILASIDDSGKGFSILNAVLIGGFVGFALGALIAATLPGKKASTVAKEFAELNRCDGCKVTFHNFYGLERVKGKEGHYCAQCRAAFAENPPAASGEQG